MVAPSQGRAPLHRLSLSALFDLEEAYHDGKRNAENEDIRGYWSAMLEGVRSEIDKRSSK